MRRDATALERATTSGEGETALRSALTRRSSRSYAHSDTEARALLAGRDRDAARKFASTSDGHAKAVSVDEAIQRADVLVLATWFDTSKQLITEYGEQLVGKVVIGRTAGSRARGAVLPPRVPVRGADPRRQPRPAKSCSSVASLVRSDVGTSPSPVSLAEHHVLFSVGHELPDLLRTAARHGDLGSPRQRLLA